MQLAHAVIKKEAALQKRMSEEAGSALLEGFCEQGGWLCVRGREGGGRGGFDLRGVVVMLLIMHALPRACLQASSRARARARAHTHSHSQTYTRRYSHTHL